MIKKLRNQPYAPMWEQEEKKSIGNLVFAVYRVIPNYCQGFLGPEFSNRKNKIKLLTEYEDVTQKVLLSRESILRNAKQLQHARLS
jgi:hypothetical protein